MDWRQAANDFPQLELSDLTRLQLPKDEQEYVLSQFNRAIMNARADSADVAMITLKKLLTQYPNWGEAALLFGICMAMDGKLRRAGASFQHAISAGLISEALTYAAQVYYRDAGVQFAKEKKVHADVDDDTAKKSRISSIFQSRKNSTPYRDSDSRERVHMQAPILMKVPRNSGKSRIASDRERIEVMSQTNSSNGEISDEEIDVTIPKTPAEKLRIALVTIVVMILAVLLGLLTWYVIIPWVSTLREDHSAKERLSYLLTELDQQKNDPQVSQILSDYNAAYPPEETSEEAGSVTDPQATVPATTAPVSTTPTPTAPALTTPTPTAPVSTTPTPTAPVSITPTPTTP